VVSDTTYTYRSSFSIFGSTVLGLCDTAIRTDPKTGVTLRSYTHYYSATSANAIERGRVRLTVNPDGTATHYAYASGENGSWTETVTQGYFEASVDTPSSLDQLFSVLHGKSTQTVVTHDFRGDVVRTDSYVHIGTGFAMAGWETHTYNLMHKRLGTMRHDGTSDLSNWICTGPVWQRNADGTSVTNTFDTAKRIKTSTRYTPFGNVTKTYTYNSDNQVVSVTTATNGVTVGCGIGCGSTYSEFDTQGRTVLSVDIIGRTNRTSYSLDNRTVTHTDPAGAVVVENYGTDGSLLSRTGTVMRAEFYAQGVDSTTGTRWEKKTYGSPTGADYSKSYYNALGQLVLQERPGFGGAILKTICVYNTKGQLESESQIVQGGTGTYDLPVTTYAYNQLGDRSSTTQAVDNVYRVQSSDSAFVVENGVVQQTSISVQSCSDLTISVMTNAAITRLYPLENGLIAESRQRDVRGNETVQKVVQDPATYLQINTVSNATSVLPAISISLAGVTLSQTDQHGCTTTYGYDALMRQISAESRSGPTNERLTGTYTHYNVIGQVDYTEDAFGTRTTYIYDSVGRKVAQTFLSAIGSLSNSTYTAYDSANRPLATWGATYPVAYEYDNAGHMIAMYTYRGTNEISSYAQITNLKSEMDRTRWLYDEATGLLTNKLYSDGKGPSYSYTALGQLCTRKWVRLDSTGQPLLTHYAYNNFGSLTNTAYSDGTPSIFFTFNALGQMKTVADASGTRTLDYAADGQMIAEALAFNTSLFTLHEKFDNLGRNTGYALSNEVAFITGTMQRFDQYGRLNHVEVDGISGTFTYGYLEGSQLQKSLAMPNGVTRTFGYELNRDLLTMIVHSNATERLVKRDFTFDGLGRLSNRTLFRANETPVNPDAFGYNSRSELTNAVMGTNAFAYEFDPIGNRNSATEFGTNTAYVASALNQYTSINLINPVVPLENFTPEFDLDGNQTLLKTTTGIWHVTYNAENRPVLFSNDTTVVEMAYDYMGRRFKYRETVNGTLARHERYPYRGYLQIAALDMLNSASVKHTIVWDPTESIATRPLVLQIGANTYYYSFDQVKNVTELFDSTGALATTYEYGPFGQITSALGVGSSPFDVTSNPLTFSSEISDSTIGLQYYNYRHLNTLTGMWVNRDPKEEKGGWNLYSLVFNQPVNASDLRGECPALVLPGIAVAVEEALKYVVVIGGVIYAHYFITEVQTTVTINMVNYCGECIEESRETKTETRTREETRRTDGPRKRNCLPCIPLVGTPMYEVHLVGASHGGVPTPHSHPYVVNQNPTTCVCFINRCGTEALPGIWFPPVTPVTGGGYAP
jgi:RHS repeat-associated protein